MGLLVLPGPVVDQVVSKFTPDELVFLASEFAGDASDGEHFEVCGVSYFSMYTPLIKRSQEIHTSAVDHLGGVTEERRSQRLQSEAGSTSGCFG